MNSLQQVSDPQAARLLLHPRVQQVLGPLLHREASVGTVAGETGLDSRVVYRDVRQLLAAGLIREVGRLPRAGKAVRLYRAVASGFFVPQDLTPDADFAERFLRSDLPADRLLIRAWARTVERAMLEQRAGRTWGLRVFWDGEELNVDESYADAEPRSVLSGWQGPFVTVFSGLTTGPLQPQEAEEIQAEFIRLFTRLSGLFGANRAAGRGRPFAVRSVLTPVMPEELAELQGT